MASIVHERSRPSRLRALTARFVKCCVRWSCGLLASPMICCWMRNRLLPLLKCDGVLWARLPLGNHDEQMAEKWWALRRLSLAFRMKHHPQELWNRPVRTAYQLQSSLWLLCVMLHHQLGPALAAEPIESHRRQSLDIRKPSVNTHRIGTVCMTVWGRMTVTSCFRITSFWTATCCF